MDFNDWERKAVIELYAEYRHIVRLHKVKLESAVIEIVDSDEYWGLWNSESGTLQLARKLLRAHPWFQVLGVLRHEMAHQLAQQETAESARPHGDAFQRACQRLGVPEQYARASLNLQSTELDWRLQRRDDLSEKMLEKVRKLLALAASANEHEAVLAMHRVREIYARYNLERKDQSQFVHLEIATGRRRMGAHEKRIANILVSHFFVEVILGETYDVASSERQRKIEIIGRRENVLMAEYVYSFIHRQLKELLAQRLVQEPRLSRVARKSFWLGVLHGFAAKLKAAERAPLESKGEQESGLIAQALARFNGDREASRYIASVYPRLSTTYTAAQRIDSSAFAAGNSAGRKITLNKPVTARTQNLGRMLSGKF